MPRFTRKEKFICYNNPNWADSALKRCEYFKARWGFACGHCCNCDICDKLRQEEREKEIAEMQESFLDMQELKIKICESESNLNGSVLNFDTSPYLSSVYAPSEVYVHDLAYETPIVSYDMPMNRGTWRVVDQNEDTTTIRYVNSPDW